MTRPANPDLANQILEKAEAIIATQGAQAINMRDLAKEIGVSPTAIYNYFSGKEQILSEVQLRIVGKLNDRIRALDPSLEPKETLRQLGLLYIDFAEENPLLYQFLFENIDTFSPDTASKSTFLYTYYTARNALERQAAHEQLPLDPRYHAMIGWIMLHGFCSLLISQRLELAEGMQRDQLKEFFMQFYSTKDQRGSLENPVPNAPK